MTRGDRHDPPLAIRPWGTFRVVGEWSGKVTVKILTLNPRSRLSLQKHMHRREEWLCLSGTAQVQIGRRQLKMKVGDWARVQRNQLHRISSEKGVEILEASYGKFSEDDIVRFEDDYGRAGKAPSGSRR
jgi:mannose-6-phosphate isomerase-like protein (cupin superfamily)